MLSGGLPLILVVVVGLSWGSVAQRRVRPSGVVAELDVSGDVLSGVFFRWVHGSVDPLDFEGRVERFRESVVET